MPMSQQDKNIQTYLTLRKITSRDSFIRRFKEPFLVQVWTAQSEADMPQAAFSTVRAGPPPPETIAIDIDGRKSRVVFRVAKSPGTAYAGMVTVGRVATNDIVLDYGAMSKFHAYFSKDSGSGKYYLTDANSTNGTFVNGSRLAPRQKCEVAEGDTICFARVLEATFRSPGAFFDFLTTLGE